MADGYNNKYNWHCKNLSGAILCQNYWCEVVLTVASGFLLKAQILKVDVATLWLSLLIGNELACVRNWPETGSVSSPSSPVKWKGQGSPNEITGNRKGPRGSAQPLLCMKTGPLPTQSSSHGHPIHTPFWLCHEKRLKGDLSRPRLVAL